MDSSLMIILVGTSGAGKSTLRDYVLHKNEKVKKLIAITDRLPRMAESNGIDKFFVSSNVFQQLCHQDELCLVNQIYGHMYAFRKKDFEDGGIYLGELHYGSLDKFIKFHPNTISIYIRAKNDDALRGLYSRGSSQEEISIRKSKQLSEVKELDGMCNQGAFDYVFDNSFTERSKQDFCRLVEIIIRKSKETKNEY